MCNYKVIIVVFSLTELGIYCEKSFHFTKRDEQESQEAYNQGCNVGY